MHEHEKAKPTSFYVLCVLLLFKYCMFELLGLIGDISLHLYLHLNNTLIYFFVNCFTPSRSHALIPNSWFRSFCRTCF